MKTKPITRPMSKSPRRVVREAYDLARGALPDSTCATSRQDFTQAQLFATLALKTFLKADYRGVAAAEVRRGPTNESPLFAGLIDQSAGPAPWDCVLADKAYDAERNHELARRQSFIRATAIPVNRRGHGRKWPRTKYRGQMRRRFP